jgi:hypothetical protein
MTFPTDKSKIRSRIASYRRILRREFESPTGFGDGYGKRLWLFPLYFLLGEETDVRDYIDWYRGQFSDDHGEVGQFMCWALILRRLDRTDEALYRFVQAIDDNLPAVAKVVGDSHAPYGMFGEEVLDLNWVDEDVVGAMTTDERRWLVTSWHSPAVTAMRERVVAIGRALVDAQGHKDRGALLDEQRGLVAAFRPAEMGALGRLGWLIGRSRERKSKGRVISTTPDVWRRGARPAPPV